MLRSIQTRLEYKILLLIIAVLIAGFGTYVVLTIQRESNALLEHHQRQVRLFSETIVSGIRNVMLTGKSPLTNEFLNDARRNLTFGSLTIYDRFGREVFLREGEGVRYNVADPLLHETLKMQRTLSTMMQAEQQEIFTRYEPLYNLPECWRCHERDHDVRGVLQLALAPNALQAAGERETAPEDGCRDGNRDRDGISNDYARWPGRADGHAHGKGTGNTMDFARAGL